MSESAKEEPIDPEIALADKWARTNPNELPPQFGGDPDKFMKSYKEQRSALTKAQQENAQLRQGVAIVDKIVNDEPVGKMPDALVIPSKPVEAPSPTQDEWGKWGTEIDTTGDITPQSREDIKKRFNIPDEIIDGYVHGVAARHKQHAQIASEIVGGSEELTGIIQWAQENLDDNERQAVNSGLSNIGWQNVLLGLKARRTQANAHSEPKTKVQTSSGISNGIKPFASPAEMTAAMRDPRYKNDPDFQENVYARLRITGHSKNDV